jgi:hemin uptake protein HemP
MTEPSQPRDASPKSAEHAKDPRVIDAGALFQDDREIVLVLNGVRYRLRITRRNKLILQK